MVANAYFEKYFYGYQEVIVRSALKLFLDALFSHQIGAPLVPTEATHQWLASYVAA